MSSSTENTGQEKPLQSWKEIAAYLERDIRTAMRWEKELGLPVRRHRDDRRSSVYAYPSELEAWRAERKPRGEETPQPSRLRRIVPALTAAAATLLVALLVSRGPILNPPKPLVKASAAGLQARQMWTGTDVDIRGTVTSDGRYLSFVDHDGNLAIHDFETGENRALTDTSWESAPSEYAISSAVSPVGTRIAFGWINARERARVQLRVGPLSDTSQRFPATAIFADEDVVYAYPAGWFPGGDRILAVLTRRDRTDQLARLSVDTNAVEILRSFDRGMPEGVSLSPRGDYVLYHRFPSEQATTRDLYLLSTSDGVETCLLEHPADERAIGWTPDGDQVLFSSDRTGTHDLYAVPVRQGKPGAPSRLIKRNLGPVWPLGVTRDRALYYGLSTGADNLYSVSYDPGEGVIDGAPEMIHTLREGFATGPAWSPDGKALAYTVQTSGGYNASWTLVLKNGDDAKERRLPLAVVHNRSLEPVWSPDGRSLLVGARDWRTRDGLFRINTQTGAAEALATTERVFSAEWAPDGESVFYVVGKHDDRRLRERNLTTGEEKELLSGTYFQELAISRNGKYLAVALRHGVGLLSIEDKEFREVARVPDDPETALDGIVNIAWADKGTHLLFVRRTKSEDSLWSVNISDGSMKDLGLTMPSLGQWGMSVHPDGRNVTFHGREAGERPVWEVWRLENLFESDPRTASGSQL